MMMRRQAKEIHVKCVCVCCAPPNTSFTPRITRASEYLYSAPPQTQLIETLQTLNCAKDPIEHIAHIYRRLIILWIGPFPSVC